MLGWVQAPLELPREPPEPPEAAAAAAGEQVVRAVAEQRAGVAWAAPVVWLGAQREASPEAVPALEVWQVVKEPAGVEAAPVLRTPRTLRRRRASPNAIAEFGR